MNNITIFVLMILTAGKAQVPGLYFADSLYERNRLQLDSILTFTAKQTLYRHELADNYKNREKIRSLLFLHHLFTSGADVTGNYGGILQIPYFWHWCKNNPRHDIIHLPSDNNLTDIPAPTGFEKYKSHADIDRTPAIYLKDLFTDSPQYYHSLTGNMYTFGWCSEREMAFSQMVTDKGYSVKIYQNGSHVWSELLLSFTNLQGKECLRIIRIDNTFDYFDMVKLRGSEEEWLNDQGEGSMKAWYNKMAVSKSESQKIAAMTISEQRFEDMNKQVLLWIASFRR